MNLAEDLQSTEEEFDIEKESCAMAGQLSPFHLKMDGQRGVH